jgi:hypothetical protein
MKRLLIYALSTAAFASVAIAQETAPTSPPPIEQPAPADQMPMDKAPPPPEQAAPTPPPNSDVSVDSNATQAPMQPQPPMQQAAAPSGGIIYQPSPDAAPPPPAADKPYPVCSKTVQDQCRNPSEGGTKKPRKK